MSDIDVFISYKSERRAYAEHLHDVLVDHGFSVWFDYALVPGNAFDQEIEEKIRAAKCVVVLWCTKSVKSEWVLDEAYLAKQLKKLIPTRIETVELPLNYKRLQTVNLTGWNGHPTVGPHMAVVEEVARFVGRSSKPDAKCLERFERVWDRMGALQPIGFGLSQEVNEQSGKPSFAKDEESDETLSSVEAPKPKPVQKPAKSASTTTPKPNAKQRFELEVNRRLEAKSEAAKIYDEINKNDKAELLAFIDFCEQGPEVRAAQARVSELEAEEQAAKAEADYNSLLSGYDLAALRAFVAENKGAKKAWKASKRIAEIEAGAPDDVTRKKWEKEARDSLLKGEDIPEERKPYIAHLELSESDFSDVNALSDLSNLIHLNLNRTQVSDVSLLSGLVNLVEVYLGGTQVSDVNALSGLINLSELHLWQTQVSDVGALSGLIKLKQLDLWGTQVSDVSALSGLVKLKEIYLYDTKVEDTSALRHIKGLEIYGP